MQYAAVIRKKTAVATRATAVIVDRRITDSPRARFDSTDRARAHSAAEQSARHAPRSPRRTGRRAAEVTGRVARARRRPWDRSSAPADTAPRPDRGARFAHRLI